MAMDRRVITCSLLLATAVLRSPVLAEDGDAAAPWWQKHLMSPKAREIERNLGIAGPDEDSNGESVEEPAWTTVPASARRRSWSKPGTHGADAVPLAHFAPLERQLRPSRRDAWDDARRSLVVLRDAIALYRAAEGCYPTSAERLAVELQPYLKHGVPTLRLWEPSSAVAETHGRTLQPSGIWNGWVYDPKSGEIAVNHPNFIHW